MSPTTKKTATLPAKRETWADWMPDTPATMTPAEFARFTNARLDTGATITMDDLKIWEEDGILPASDGHYPPIAWRLISDHLQPESAEYDTAHTRSILRSLAGTLDRTVERTAHRLTWRDWMSPEAPEPQLLSHDELIEELKERGVDVTAATLEHWRRNGVIPRPLRRHHNGQTRPVYPSWMVPAIVHLRQLQDAGKTLEEIAPWMRSHALSSAPLSDPLADILAELHAALRKLAEAAEPDAASATVTFHDATGERLPFHHDMSLAP